LFELAVVILASAVNQHRTASQKEWRRLRLPPGSSFYGLHSWFFSATILRVTGEVQIVGRKKLLVGQEQDQFHTRPKDGSVIYVLVPTKVLEKRQNALMPLMHIASTWDDSGTHQAE
jgi:hypothetical protein